MKLTLLTWLSVCSLLLLFTGCSDDDQPNNTSTQNTGTNPNNQPYRCLAPWGVRSGATLTLEDGSSRIQILLVDEFAYKLMFQASPEPEKGTYTVTPSGDRATVVLMPDAGGTTRTINLVINSSTQGTYTSDSLGQGTFTSDGPLFVGGCGLY